MPDFPRFNALSNELARALSTIGLKAPDNEVSFDAERSVTVAQWADRKPIISVWYGNWFVDRPNDFILWAGFEGGKRQVTALRDAIKANGMHHVSEFARFKPNEWTRRNVPDGHSTVICEFDNYAYYLGLYETSLNASSIDDLANKYFDLISNIIENIEPAVAADIEKLRDDKRNGLINETTFEQLIQARRGQGHFRKQLDRIWDNQCATSRCRIYQTLRASHIRPWRASNNAQRLDPENGLLLNAFVDSLFDKGLISFDDEGAMIISEDLPLHEIDFFRLEGMELSKKPSARQKEYLRYHREKLGKNLK